MGLRILVTGGRFYKNVGYVWKVLHEVHRLKGIDEIVHGATHTYTGADWCADDWAKVQNVRIIRCYVKEKLDGPWPAAGMRRNERMLDTYRPHGVIAFPGGNGTAHMVRIAHEAGVKIMDLRFKPEAQDDSQIDAVTAA
jgi:YspA, cpYpsA-related SLOG family